MSYATSSVHEPTSDRFARSYPRGPWHLVNPWVFYNGETATLCGAVIRDHWDIVTADKAHAESKESYDHRLFPDGTLEPGMVWPFCRVCDRVHAAQES